MSQPDKRYYAIFRLVFLSLILISVSVVLFIRFRDSIFNKEWLMALPGFLKSTGYDPAVFLLGLQILQVIICFIPGQPIQLVSGYMLGFFPSLLLSLAGATIGASAAFFFSRIAGRKAVETIIGEDKTHLYHRKLNSGKGLTILLLLYLIPGLPKDVLAYIAGVSEIGFRPFIIISTAGRAPGMCGSLLIGYCLAKRYYISVALILAAALVIILISVLKRQRIEELIEKLEQKQASDNKR